MRAALWLLALFAVAVAAALFAGNNQSTLPSTAFAAPLAVSVAPVAVGEPVDGGLVTFTPPGSGAE